MSLIDWLEKRVRKDYAKYGLEERIQEQMSKKKSEPTPDPIVHATTPDFLPASQNPGGIPVTDSDGNVAGGDRDEVPPSDPGRIAE